MTSASLEDVHAHALRCLWFGVKQGWWEDVDEDLMLPIRVVFMEDFHEHATMAHAWMRTTKKYASMKEAKRAGWGKPLTPGLYRTGTYVLRVEKRE